MLLEWSGWAGTGMAVMNAIIIAFLIAGLIVGFLRGFVETSVGFLEFLLVVLFAFILKNPFSVFFYTKFPFFDFDIQVMNILLYEVISFIVVCIIFAIILYIVNKFIRIIQRVFNLIIGIGIPTGVLGAIISFIEFYLVLYIFIFIVFWFSAFTGRPIDESLANKVFYDTPILKDTAGPVLQSFIDIADISYKNEDKKVVDYKALEVLLKYEVISSDNAKLLVDSNKLNINGSKELISKYAK